MEENGYLLIKKAPAKAAARAIRGFKTKKKKESHQAEAKIVITTMER